VCEAPAKVVIDEFTSVVDRQIAKVGALAFQKAWRRTRRAPRRPRARRAPRSPTRRSPSSPLRPASAWRPQLQVAFQSPRPRAVAKAVREGDEPVVIAARARAGPVDVHVAGAERGLFSPLVFYDEAQKLPLSALTSGIFGKRIGQSTCAPRSPRQHCVHLWYAPPLSTRRLIARSRFGMERRDM
jgi:hypothetical protein